MIPAGSLFALLQSVGALEKGIFGAHAVPIILVIATATGIYYAVMKYK